jgi:hypothetical protein
MRASLTPLLAILAAGACSSAPRSPDRDLAALRAVESEGAGNAEASRAWREVVAQGPPALLPVLAAFDGAGPRAANWLRAAADAIAESALGRGETLDAKALEAFVLDTRHDGRGRRLAYEWLIRIDPGAPARLLPGMLGDPSRDLRRDAVARALSEAEQRLKEGNKEGAAESFRTILPHARDRDQVDALAKHLKGLGVAVDVQAHYGVISRWTLISSFDNTGMKGFDVPYGPEKSVLPGAPLAGKGGQPVRYVDFTTADPNGKVDLNAALGKEMGSVAYAFAAVESPDERPVELRVGTNNAVKMFLNGALLFFRNEYHHGMKMDQYVGRGRLRKGLNEVLIKVCQNEQKEDWAQGWSFQARLCDALGGAVPFRVAAR